MHFFSFDDNTKANALTAILMRIEAMEEKQMNIKNEKSFSHLWNTDVVEFAAIAVLLQKSFYVQVHTVI